MPSKKLFISHASRDRQLVDELVDLLLVGCNVPQAEILCTSLEGMDIPAGKDFISFLKEQIQQPRLVILVLSPNYYNSVFCLCELGACWGLSLNTFPLVVPPLRISDIGDTLKVTQMGEVKESSYLDKMRDTVNTILEVDIAHLSTARWNRKRDQFLAKLQSVLDKLPQPDRVFKKQYDELDATYRDSLNALNEAEAENERLKTVIEDLKKLKDAEQVSEVLIQHSTYWEAFDALVEQINRSLDRLPHIVRRAIYYHWIDEALDTVSKDAKEAEENRFLYHDGMNGYRINDDDPGIRDVLVSLEKLRSFLNEPPDDFYDQFFEENDFAPQGAIGNKRFWNNYFIGRY